MLYWEIYLSGLAQRERAATKTHHTDQKLTLIFRVSF